MCILGPSGAGKSTLLNILAGRMNTKKKGMEFSGDISICGYVVNPVAARSNIAYVMQEDALPGMSTPREILTMSAVLRGRETGVEVTEKVKNLLAELRLENCADTYVGTPIMKGLSGGEKKRTSVALELITGPKMIFLDEPLSGLDSYAAMTIIQVLKELAAKGCAVLCTIHQPSSEIFQLFDRVACLAEGRTCYFDSVNRLPKYMEQLGHPVTTYTNPADHILFFVQSQTKENLALFNEAWATEEQKVILPQIEEARASASALPPSTIHRKSCLSQLGFLVQRELREVFRNKIGLVMRFGVNAFMGLLFAFIFKGVGAKDNETGGIHGHFGAICNLMIGTMFSSAQPLLLQFPLERPVFLREYGANMYGTIPYFLAKTIIEIPLTFLTALETWLISYWVMELQGNFFYLVVISTVLAVSAASTALWIGCSVANAQQAQEFAPLLFVPQILFTGIFIQISLIPEWLRWLQYLCSLKYAINLACIVEFGSSPIGVEIILDGQQIEKDRTWLYVGILAAILVGFRLLAMISLRRRATFVF